MKTLRVLMQGGCLAGLVALASGCIVAEPREGYYDGPHHRYYHEHAWHECIVGDPFCR